MPLVTDWLMVAVTFVYVVATCFICWANIRSARASREQVREMRRQHEDTKRLELLPFFQLRRIEKPDRVDGTLHCRLLYEDPRGGELCETFYFELKNIGRGIAKEVHFAWERIACGDASPVIISLPVGDSRRAGFTVRAFDGAAEPVQNHVRLRICYRDLLDHAYTQMAWIAFCVEEGHIRFVKCYTDVPKPEDDPA